MAAIFVRYGLLKRQALKYCLKFNRPVNQVARVAPLIGLCFVLLSSCGFKPRGSFAVPDNMKFICLDQSASPELGIELKKRFIRSKVSLINDTNTCVNLVLNPEEVERPVLSLFPNAQVAEYELIYKVSYSVTFPNQDTQIYKAEAARDYQDNPEAVLAKSKESKLLLAELRRHAAEQILLQLASLEQR